MQMDASADSGAPVMASAEPIAVISAQ
jgi:hypothetical protein